MRVWYTFGAFGDTVVEFGWRDIWALLRGRTIQVRGASFAVSFGRSKLKSLGAAPSRERQLCREAR